MTTKRSQPAGAPFDECLLNQTQVPMSADDHQLFLASDRVSNASSRPAAPRSSASNLPMTVKDAATLPWREPPNGVSLGGAKADSPPPRDGSQYPVFEIGFGAIPRAVQTRGGEWQDRVSMMAWFINETTATSGGCATGTRTGSRRLESTNTTDWDEAQRQLRERLSPETTTPLRSSARENNSRSTNGRTFSWRTTPSRRFGLRRLTRPTRTH